MGINKLLSNRELLAEIVKNQKKKLKEFDSENIYSHWINAINSVVIIS